MPFTRRSFFSRSGLVAAGALAAPSFSYGKSQVPFRANQRPRNIIHLVCDGMSSGTLTCADALSHLERGRGLSWLELYKNPEAQPGLMDMRSLNSLVTDSSAASSSWGSGSRIVNGAVNVLPDGRKLTPLYTLFGQNGWKRGLVTTTEITHATPSGFAANDESRGSAEAIAVQFMERGVDVLLGGGVKHVAPERRKDKRDLLGEFSKRGYQIFKTAADLDKAKTDGKWLGIFADSHLPFTIDQTRNVKDRVNVPTLAQMTGAALKKLSRESHFILQVEGGRVDHACHGCDAAAGLYDLIAFDEALEVCLEFQKQAPDTLLVITTDHGTGNMGLNGMGDNYGGSSKLFANLQRVKASFSEITRNLKAELAPSEIKDLIAETTGYEMKDGQPEMLSEFLRRKGKTLYSSMNNTTTQLGQLMANHTGIGWTSGAHTADYVPIIAAGPGAERFRGFIQNTDVFHHYLSFGKIDFRNPSLPLQASNAESAQSENVEEYFETAVA